MSDTSSRRKPAIAVISTSSGRSSQGSQVVSSLLRQSGYEVISINPAQAPIVDLTSLVPAGISPGSVDAVVISLGAVTPQIARQRQLPPGVGGVVMEVAPRSAAARAGLAPGDVILEVDRRRVTNVDEAVAELRRVPAGRTAFALVARDGQQHFLTSTKPA